MDEDDLVGIGIFEEITLHAFLRGGQNDVTVVVHQYRHAGCQVVGCRCDMKPFKAAVFQHSFLGDLGGYADGVVGGDDAGRGMAVIKEGVIVRKTLGTEELL